MIPACGPSQYHGFLVQAVTHVREKYIQPSVLPCGRLADVLDCALVANISLDASELG